MNPDKPRELDLSKTGIDQDYFNEFGGLCLGISGGLYRNNFDALLKEISSHRLRTYQERLEPEGQTNFVNDANRETVTKLDAIVNEINQGATDNTLTAERLASLLKEAHDLIYGYPADNLLPYLRSE